MPNYVNGIDVSVIQGTIDWNAVAATGVQFTIVRCAVGNSSIDINYNANITGAQAAGIKVMAYHFIYPLPPLTSQPLRDPIKQAQYHFNAVQGQMAAIDCEWPAPQDFATWGCTPSQINQWMIAYFTEYTSLDNGRNPLLYTYPYWAQAVNFDPSFTQYPLWIASYQTTPYIPAPWTTFALWRNTGGGGKLPNGAPVDTDLAVDLSLWLPAPVAVPPQTPVITSPTVVPSSPNFFQKILNFILNFFKSL